MMYQRPNIQGYGVSTAKYTGVSTAKFTAH